MMKGTETKRERERKGHQRLAQCVSVCVAVCCEGTDGGKWRFYIKKEMKAADEPPVARKTSPTRTMLSRAGSLAAGFQGRLE